MPSRLQKNVLTKSALLLSIIAFSTLSNAYAADVEHWQCTAEGHLTKWTIVENRMFAADGKGDLAVISNSSTLTVAYLVISPKDPFTSWVYIIDKVGGRSVSYDDIIASNIHGVSEPADPHVVIGSCAPLP
jgi:hypothetical protein